MVGDFPTAIQRSKTLSLAFKSRDSYKFYLFLTRGSSVTRLGRGLYSGVLNCDLGPICVIGILCYWLSFKIPLRILHISCQLWFRAFYLFNSGNPLMTLSPLSRGRYICLANNSLYWYRTKNWNWNGVSRKLFQKKNIVSSLIPKPGFVRHWVTWIANRCHKKW